MTINNAAEKSADLTRQLLAFARKQIITPKVIELNETVFGMLKMLQRLTGENINLKWQAETALWQVMVDPSQIDQILANLCINARDAITNVGNITIQTENCTVDKECSSVFTDVEPGEYVKLAVSDDGCGMDEETKSLIFEPFFTTKGIGVGTGLGLSTIYGIVEQNKGFICVESNPGIGTTFSIYLPRYVGKIEQIPKEKTTGPTLRGNETILLVEDEPDILNMTSMVLARQGYTVLQANTPGEAARLAREHTGKIHMLMTDVIMPEMNGRDLANSLQSLNPDLKCLFMSGYTADIIACHGVLDDGVHFIEKPFSLTALTDKVRDVLDNGGITR